MTNDRRITVAEAAALLGLSRQGVMYALDKGYLSGERISPKLWLVNSDSVEAYRDAPPVRRRPRRKGRKHHSPENEPQDSSDSPPPIT